MSVGNRLKEVLDNKDITPYKLHKGTGISQSTIGGILKDKHEPNRSTIVTISNFLKVNPDWLLEEKGEKYIDIEVKNFETNTSLLTVNEPEEQLTNKNGNVFVPQKGGKFKIYVKKVPVKAFGSYISESNDPEFFNELEQVSFTVDHLGRGNYICFEVQGESMNGGGLYDAPEGAELLCRELGRQHWKDGFRDSVYGWVIVHKDTVLYKDIIDFNLETGDITCHSRSGLPQHPDFKVNLNDVRQIWKVIKRSF